MWLLRLLLSSLFIGFSSAQVYEIAEPDMLSEIEKFEAVNKISKEIIKAKERFFSFSGESLSPSDKNYVYYVDPTYTLEVDIPKVDREGKIVGILYPKGYRFNPLEHLQIKPPPIIIFNACDDREVAVVKRLMKEKKHLAYILVSAGCSIKELKDKKVYNILKQRIYLLTKELKNKLHLNHTISFVDVDLKKKRIRVEVYKKDIN